MPPDITAALRRRWNRVGGYRELLTIALPLIAGTGAWSIQHFLDRMFLSWHSPEAVAAAMPAGLLAFTIGCTFIGTAGYVGTFTAQYLGAGLPRQCGSSLWQGIYVALAGGVVHLLFVPFAGTIFSFIGHGPIIEKYQQVYFIMLSFGGFFVIASAAMAGFLSGIGRTWPIMWTNIAVTTINLFLDWILIFGNWGFPELGVAGAGLSTFIAMVSGTIIYSLILVRPHYRRRYDTIKGWRFEKPLFSALIRYGFPSGLQFLIDTSGFTLFIFFVGRLGTEALASTTIAFNISTLAFMPMIGIGIAVSVLVARRLGENRPDLARRSTWSAFHLTMGYMATISLFYFIRPEIFIFPFAKGAAPENFTEISAACATLLKFVAVYSLFDTMNIIFSSALKGAGDTHYIMRVTLALSVMLLIIPSWAAISFLSWGLYGLWTIASLYIATTGCFFLVRFLGGTWESMRVIGEVPIVVPTTAPETPLPE